MYQTLPVNQSFLSSGGTLTTVNPLASQCNTDPVALTYFYGLANPQELYWEPLTTAAGTRPHAHAVWLL